MVNLWHGRIVDKSQYIILAPHVDDEVIGCYRLLMEGSVTHVFYFYELSFERKKEAVKCSLEFGFTPMFMDDDTAVRSLIELSKERVVLAPSIHDLHPDHKRLNRYAKNISNAEVMFYSVDMNTKFDVLNEIDRVYKGLILKTIFKSQEALFNNEKYFLFESTPVTDESTKMIWVKFQHEGIHCYPAALTEPSLADVKFLGHDHRHIFHYKVSIEVFHDDRDIEFIQFKRWLRSLYDSYVGGLSFNHQSCEMLADRLAFIIQRKYPGRKLTIEVSEDDENGVYVEYTV